MTYDFDFFVIGGGSAGVRAARIAAGYGARVALAEEYRYGGTCVIRGCVPKKLLMYGAEFSDAFFDSAAYGWSLDGPRFDWARMIAAKDKEIDRLEGVYRGLLQGSGVTLFDGRAQFTGPHALMVGAKAITAERILIATGARPTLPDIPGCELMATSNDLFALPALPRRVVIVGAGFIACEFASIFQGFGAQVTLIHRGAQLLRGFDGQMADHLAEGLRLSGVDLRLEHPIDGVERTQTGLAVLSGPHRFEGDLVLAATGRIPNTEGLDCSAAGLALGPRGAVTVDEFSRSNVSHIYAVGDVTDRVHLTPVAIREGHAVADSLFGGKPTPVRHDLIPQAVFSRPQLAFVGLNEEEAVARHGRVAIYESRFTPMKQTLSGRPGKTLMKLIALPDNGRVLGLHMAGPDAAEIIQSFAVALKMGATKADFDATFALHPSAAEEFVTMRSLTRMAGGERALA